MNEWTRAEKDPQTLSMFGDGGERSEAVDAKCSNAHSGCRTTMTTDRQQVEHIVYRDNLRMNVCGRYVSLADLCRVFGMRMTARKKEREVKVMKEMNTPSMSLISSSTHLANA